MDISSKISGLQCSWVIKLYDQNSYDSKLIPMHFVNNAFGKNFIFYSNLTLKAFVFHQFPTFNVNILQSWKRNFSHISYHSHITHITPNCIGSRFLWLNNYVTTDNKSVHFKEFSSHNINFINQLFISEAEFKDWNHIK